METHRSRKYRLRPGEPIGDEVRRAALGRTVRAVERLQEEISDDPVAAVHGARRDLKKLRSSLRLARAGIGKRRRQRINSHLRDAAGLLSGARDAQVMVETVEMLRQRNGAEFPDHLTVDFVEELRRGRRERANDPGENVDAAIALIECARQDLTDWRPKAGGFDLLQAGLHRSYARGRSELERVIEDPSEMAVHDWRKRVKDHGYHLRLLEPLWPPVIGGRRGAADEIAELLGEHHDLTVLAAAAESDPADFGAGGREKLIELANRRGAEILDQAIPAGRKLYAEKPKRFVAQVAAYAEVGSEAG